jgi:flagellar hook-associated protein 1
MSLTSGLSSALSGLTASARAAEIVSSNVANAMTEGYGRRELQLAARITGGSGTGVSITGVMRRSDPLVLADRRLADAGSGARDATAQFYARLETAIGTPDTATSLNGRIAAFDSALLEASSRPESESRLANLIQSARELTTHISAAAASVQEARGQADAQIATLTDQLNSALARVSDLNGKIVQARAAGRDTSPLIDQRQQQIDAVSAIIPLREVARDNGQVALYTTGGAIVLDGPPAQFGFTPVGVIVPGMSVEAGGLSGLTMNGRALSTVAEGGPISGGSLAAQFEIRDVLAPQAQSQLDAVARDLVERFSDPTLDSTLPLGAPGLFTNAGLAFDPLTETGLAQRLAVNAAADPNQGGALFRLRDGLGAATPGLVGNSSLLTALRDALTAPRPASSGDFGSAARSFASLSADFLSDTSSSRVRSAGEASYAAAQRSTLKQVELQNGVDTDQEMQSLMLIEQAYSANAKVITTIDGLLKTLLEM